MSALFRDLSAALIAECELTDTRPGQLIEISWKNATPSRLSTFANVTVLGYDWIKADVLASNLSEDSKGKSSGMLTFGNANNVWGALALEPKFRDQPIRVWDIYAGATADADVVQRFSGVGDAAKILGNGQVQVQLGQPSGLQFCPRLVLGPETGFNHLPAAGLRNIGGQQWMLQPGMGA